MKQYLALNYHGNHTSKYPVGQCNKDTYIWNNIFVSFLCHVRNDAEDDHAFLSAFAAEATALSVGKKYKTICLIELRSAHSIVLLLIAGDAVFKPGPVVIRSA